MDRRVEKAYDIIKKKYNTRLLLKYLAGKVGLSPFHFQRLFKQEMKETPAECVTRIRIERACHLLKANTGMSLSSVAADCGFSSLSTFSRTFSQQVKMAPKTFSLRTDPSIKVIRIRKGLVALDVEIVYFPDRYFFYNTTAVMNPDLLKECKAAKAFCEMSDMKTKDRLVGIGTHVTFHYPNQKLNYYVGVELEGPPPAKFAERVFFAPKGKYACYRTMESCELVQENGMRFHIEWLTKSKYHRRDLFGIEEFADDIKNSDYPYLKRRVCVPIKSAKT
jgi:AraC-like DNA-binding protein